MLRRALSSIDVLPGKIVVVRAGDMRGLQSPPF